MTNRKIPRLSDDWEIALRNGGHLKATHIPSGAIVFTGSTPSDNRGLLNFQARVRRIERQWETS